jgi:ribokinase
VCAVATGRYARVVPALPRRPAAAHRPPRVIVIGDLVLDAVLAPSRPLESGTDVPGSVAFRQGGSAATTARWLARLGVRTSLVAAIGRDPIGRALVDTIRADGVIPRVARIAGRRTGRIGVLVGPGGERSFVADRGAADALAPGDLRAGWFRGADAVHLPAYSLLGEPLGLAGRSAIELGRAEGALISLDLASIAPLLARGRRAARQLVMSIRPDILFATQAEAEALIGRYSVDELLDFGTLAVVKRGAEGATLLVRGPDDRRLRVEVATKSVATSDSTGAGDAFDAGFLASYLAAWKAGRSGPSGIHRAALAGHRAARRHLTSPRLELSLG